MNFKPNIGDVFLNKYKIVSLVGEGAFGSVYRATDMKLDRIVAIKFINTSGNTIERFTDELDAIKNLDHPNIVRLYDYDILRGGIPCIVMEFVNGREIGDILAQKGPFEPLRICEIAKQILDALVETHRNGIIHCDLKPENIMLTSLGARSDVVKLIDFGVASILSKTTDEGDRSKLLVGTPQYMAPEQITHAEIGPWTDTYALGLILIELFTGQFVFDHDDPREVLKMQLHNPVVLPHGLACTELGPIIAKATEKSISKRYRSTQQFYNDLCDAMQSMQTKTRPQPMRRRSSTDRWQTNTNNSLMDDLSDFGIVPESRRPVAGTVARMHMHDSDLSLDSILPPGLGGSDSGAVDQDSITSVPVLKGNDVSGEFQVPLITTESLAGVKSPIRKDASSQAPVVPELKLGIPELNVPELKLDSGVENKADLPKTDKPEESPDLTALQNSLGSLVLADVVAKAGDAAAQETPAAPLDMSSLEAALPVDNGISANGGDLSPASVVEAKPRVSAVLPAQKKKNPMVGVIVACFILLLLAGGGVYCMKTGVFDALMNGSGAKPVKTKPADVAVMPAPEEKQNIVHFSTLQDTAKKMAYSAAISGHYGTFNSVEKYKTYRVIGTPINAAIYVDDSQVCAKTPCRVHLYGDPAKIKLEIRKGDKRNSADISSHDARKPVILVLGN